MAHRNTLLYRHPTRSGWIVAQTSLGWFEAEVDWGCKKSYVGRKLGYLDQLDEVESKSARDSFRVPVMA